MPPVSTAEVRILLNAVDKASPVAKSAFATISQAAKDFGSGLGVTLERFTNPAILAGEAVRKIGKFAKESLVETVAYAKEVRDFSLALGITAEEASALIQVSDDLVISTDSLQQAMRYAINKGVDISIEGIKELSVQYNELETPMEKSQFAMEKFGKFAGLEMQKLLEASTEQIDEMTKSAQEAGLIMSGEAVANARKYEIAMDNLGDSIQGIKYQIGNELIPEMVTLMDTVNLNISANLKYNRVEAEAKRQLEEGIITKKQYKAIMDETIDGILFGTISIEELNKAQQSLTTTETAYLEALSQSNAVITGYNGYIVEQKQVADEAAIANSRMAASIIEVSDAAFGAMILGELNTLYSNGTITMGEYRTLAGGVMEDMLGMQGAAIEAAFGVAELKEMLADGTITAGGFVGQAEALLSLLERIRDTDWSSNASMYGQHIPGYAAGADFIVPPNYPNDSFVMGVSSGEHVRVTNSSQISNNYNLNIHSSARTENLAADFALMQALAR